MANTVAMPIEKLPHRVLEKAAQMFAGSSGFSHAEMNRFFEHELKIPLANTGPTSAGNRLQVFNWWMRAVQ